jgi:hypothetical protein
MRFDPKGDTYIATFKIEIAESGEPARADRDT